jgi:hypothetical protein
VFLAFLRESAVEIVRAALKTPILDLRCDDCEQKLLKKNTYIVVLIYSINKKRLNVHFLTVTLEKQVEERKDGIKKKGEKGSIFF